MGVWLGITERTEEILIGTKYEMVKRRPVSRLDEDERWNRTRVMEMKSTPWEPIPRTQQQHIPVDVADNGDNLRPDSENEEGDASEVNDETKGKEYQINLYKLHASQKAIKKFGTTQGCAACAAIQIKGDRPGRIGRHHSQACKKRIIETMETNPQYKHIQAHTTKVTWSQCQQRGIRKSEHGHHYKRTNNFNHTCTRKLQWSDLERCNHKTKAHTAHNQREEGYCTNSKQNGGRNDSHEQMPRNQFG